MSSKSAEVTILKSSICALVCKRSVKRKHGNRSSWSHSISTSVMATRGWRPRQEKEWLYHSMKSSVSPLTTLILRWTITVCLWTDVLWRFYVRLIQASYHVTLCVLRLHIN